MGVGPGDPELLTIKACRILSQVPVIFIPQKNEDSKSYAYTIIDGSIDNPSQKIEPLIFPMQKDPHLLTRHWENAVNQIWQTLIQGKDCAFINEGDPLLYGTFNYIFEIFKSRYPQAHIEIIPGVSSINAAFASARLPMVTNRERLIIIPATYEHDINSLRRIIEDADTIVFLKVNSMFDKILEFLEDMELIEKSIYIRRCTTRDEEIVTNIRTLKGKSLDYLSLLVVRKQQ